MKLRSMWRCTDCNGRKIHQAERYRHVGCLQADRSASQRQLRFASTFFQMYAASHSLIPHSQHHSIAADRVDGATAALQSFSIALQLCSRRARIPLVSRAICVPLTTSASLLVPSAMSSPPNPNSFRQTRFFKTWLSDRATYPLFIIMGCAGVLVAFAGGRTLFSHPDVYVGKGARSSMDREDALDRGTRHSTNWLRSMAKSKSDSDSISVWPSLNKSLLSKHVNPDADRVDDDSDD